MICLSDANPLPSSAGSSRIILTMVGTNRVSVTPCASIAAMVLAASNAGMKQCEPPAITTPIEEAPSARWNIGVACRYLVPLSNLKPYATPTELDHNPRCGSMTPFGYPVVPPV